MHDLVLIHISGQDRPGLLHQFTAKLAEYGVEILDLGQSVIHESLSLGILVRIPPTAHSAPILKEMLFMAHELGVTLQFSPIGHDRYQDWAGARDRPRYIITLVSRSISAAQLASVSKVLVDNGLSVDFAHRLSGRATLRDNAELSIGSGQACVELSVRGSPRDLPGMRKDFLNISAELGVDIGFQEDDLYRRNRRLVAFDMDSTLIAAEVIDELAAEAGVGDAVRAITERAMRGEMDFKESLKNRLALLKGLPQERMEAVAERIPLTDGAQRLIHNLRRLGYKTAIISGGFTYFGQRLQRLLGIDYVFANTLELEDGRLTGRVQGEVVDAARKAELLRHIASKENIDLRQVIAVGDGANDLPMLNLAGLGIAFHAKPVVKEGAKQAISHLGLDAILYLLGVRDRDTEIVDSDQA